MSSRDLLVTIQNDSNRVPVAEQVVVAVAGWIVEQVVDVDPGCALDDDVQASHKLRAGQLTIEAC